MIVVCIADTHGALPPIPECDLLIVAGDFAPGINLPDQQRYILGPFKQWMKRQPAKEIIVVAGNHEQVIEHWGWPHGYLPGHYLQDSGVRTLGLSIWGTPWQPWFLDWAFNAPERDEDELFLADKFSKIPMGTDIIVAHTPPWGILDRNSRGRRCGSRALLMRMLEVRPKLLVCGHIHDSGGRTQDVNGTLVVNAAVMNIRRDNDPVVVDV